MFKLLQAVFGFRSDFDENSSRSSSASSGEGIEVRVGRLPHARFVHISHSALEASPVLCALSHGCNITNADAVVFEVTVEYLNGYGLLRQLRPSARNPLTQLTGGCDKMLKLAKAWHLADMLDDMGIQNKLVDTYRIIYLELLRAHTVIPLDHTPFVYLESHLGTHTRIEKFIIDFYAGLARHTGEFTVEELLPFRHDIAQALKVRRAQLMVQGVSGDMIATGNTCFNVSKADTTRHAALHVIKPTRVPSSTDLNSLPSQRGFSTSSLWSLFSPPRSPRAEISSTSLRYDGGHQLRLSLPEIASVDGHSETSVSRTLVPALQSTFGVARRPSHTRSVSLMTSLPSRAPFMAPKPVFRRQHTDVSSEDDSSDEDTAYDLLSPGPRLR
jgi:hypothetical protein